MILVHNLYIQNVNSLAVHDEECAQEHREGDKVHYVICVHVAALLMKDGFAMEYMAHTTRATRRALHTHRPAHKQGIRHGGHMSLASHI